MGDRKHMRKLREKRIKSIQKQIDKHEWLIDIDNSGNCSIFLPKFSICPILRLCNLINRIVHNEEGRLDTTKDYWAKEIDEKFVKQIDKDEDYLEGEK